MGNEFKEIASRIRELRDACGYTQEEMAAFVKVDPETYAGYELHGENIALIQRQRSVPVFLSMAMT